jgi:PilZ domain-containing protein
VRERTDIRLLAKHSFAEFAGQQTPRPADPVASADAPMAYRFNGMEHRWGERICVNIMVQIAAGALDGINGCLTNLSLSGALIQTKVDVRVYSLIQVTLKMPSTLQGNAMIKGHVTRKLTDEYIGVEWCEFAPEPVKLLLRPLRFGIPAI